MCGIDTFSFFSKLRDVIAMTRSFYKTGHKIRDEERCGRMDRQVIVGRKKEANGYFLQRYLTYTS